MKRNIGILVILIVIFCCSINRVNASTPTRYGENFSLCSSAKDTSCSQICNYVMRIKGTSTIYITDAITEEDYIATLYVKIAAKTNDNNLTTYYIMWSNSLKTQTSMLELTENGSYYKWPNDNNEKYNFFVSGTCPANAVISPDLTNVCFGTLEECGYNSDSYINKLDDTLLEPTVAEIQLYKSGNTTDTSGIIYDDEVDCTSMQIIVSVLQDIFNILKYIAIALVIVLSSIDFLKAVAAQNKDELKKASGKAIKRLIIAVIIFFVPIILDFILEVFLNVENGTCGIR